MNVASNDIDVSGLPEDAFGSRGLLWWGALGFIAIEATMLALCIVSYFYLRSVSEQWPPSVNGLPKLTVATCNLGVLLLSILPMYWAEKASRRMDQKATVRTLWIANILGLVSIVLRCFEFNSFNVRWDSNAYGSIVWTLLGLHTFHIVTDVVETIVLTVFIQLGHTDKKYFADVNDDAIFWYFIVAGWVIVYAVLFISPRVLT
jgi:cytochrome c oxidase subunit 3